MKPRIGVRPIAGASTGLLLLLLAGYFILRNSPPAPPSLPGTSGTGVIPPLSDTLATDRSAALAGVDTSTPGIPPAATRPVHTAARRPKAVPRPVHVGVSYYWAGGRTRPRLTGDLPVVTGLNRKTTVVLEATVTAAGKVRKLSVLQGSRNSMLLDRTIAAVRSWRFERLPRNRKGASERCRITVTFRPPA